MVFHSNESQTTSFHNHSYIHTDTHTYTHMTATFLNYKCELRSRQSVVFMWYSCTRSDEQKGSVMAKQQQQKKKRKKKRTEIASSTAYTHNRYTNYR